MSGVTLITCTGGRPESLARCASYVGRFDNPRGLTVQWIVVDDDGGSASAPFPSNARSGLLSVSYIKPAHVWSPGMNTLAANLLTAIEHVSHDKILFIEDDDYYHADYMMQQVDRLDNDGLVGEGVSWYYHVPTRRWREMYNVHHASLCQTGMRSSLLGVLSRICSAANPEFIDWCLWGGHVMRSQCLVNGVPRVVGIKGMPGRPGIGVGHRPDLGAGWNTDLDGAKLREWLGNDAEAYIGPKQAA